MFMYILHLQNIQSRLKRQAEGFEYFFLNALNRGSTKLLIATLCISNNNDNYNDDDDDDNSNSSYVMQHEICTWMLAQQINQRSLWAR